MTVEEIHALVRVQSTGNLKAVNDHRITLEDVLLAPQKISIVVRQIRKGHVKDERINVWLVGQENRPEGYKIILREDGSQFGLASAGFANDTAAVLVGWYGDLLTAFMGM